MNNVFLLMGPGRLLLEYPGQNTPQPVVADIDARGTVFIHANPEIGTAVPQNIALGVRQRITLRATSKAEARQWYRDHRATIARLVAGMASEWRNGSHVGTLTEDARAALEELEYGVYAGR